MTKKLLYYFWGFLSDKKDPKNKYQCISSPDGNATSSIWIIDEFQKRGWDVYCVVDRDKESVDKYEKEAFSAFSKDFRYNAYKKIKFLGLDNFECDCWNMDFDLVLNEYRFPTKDNSKTDGTRTPDLKIQNIIIGMCWNKDIPLILMDLDYKLSEQDEINIRPWKIIEQGVKPKRNHITNFTPITISEFSQFKTEIPFMNRDIMYIGSYYEREDDFNNKIIPYAQKHSGTVFLVGNYMKEKTREFREKNTQIIFNDRVRFDDFHDLYSKSTCVPLLAKNEYKQNGFMTGRLIESLLFGGLPLGFSDFYGIEQWLPKELVIDMTNYEYDMEQKMGNLKKLGFFQRIELRKKLLDDIGKKHDVKELMNTLLEGGNF